MLQICKIDSWHFMNYLTLIYDFLLLRVIIFEFISDASSVANHPVFNNQKTSWNSLLCPIFSKIISLEHIFYFLSTFGVNKSRQCWMCPEYRPYRSLYTNTNVLYNKFLSIYISEVLLVFDKYIRINRI